MKQLLFFASLLLTLGLQAQVTGISVETYVVHDGSIEELTGYTTYHVYANTTSSADFISAVYGDSENPLGLSVEGNIYHSAPSFNFGSEVNPMMFPVLPTLEFDSWMTIGMMSSEDAGVIGNIGLDDAFADFTANGTFYVDDPIGGSWYNTIPCDPMVSATCTDDYPQFGGADNKVLLAQITTDGHFSGVFNLQVFNGGDQALNEYVNGLCFSSDPTAICGCTDPGASNYNPDANTDDYSCVLPCTIELVVESVVSPTCAGDNDGSMVITSTGAQGSDDYYLGEDDEQPSNFGNFNGLLAGSYYVMVEDGAGCQSSQYVEIPEVAEVTVSTNLAQAMTCNNTDDAIIEVFGMGGDGNLQFYFAGDDPSTMSENTVFTDLTAGSYTVVAVDGNGCTGASLPTQVSNPPAINVYVTATSDASCADIADGQIVVSATGGAAPTTLEFLIDGTTYDSSPILIQAGTFTVEAIDINGCIGTAADDVVIGPDQIFVNASATPVACTDEESGSISWAPSGGAEGFTVDVDGEEQSGSSLVDLAVGFYTVLVEDANGCTSSEIIEVLNAEPIIATTEVTNVLCNGGSDGAVIVSATGGTGSFQYSDDDNNYSSENEFENLSAGEYVFYVQDENGCEEGISAIVDEPSAMVVSGIVSNPDVLWGEGYIDANVTGGTPDYSYEWTGPNVNGFNDQDIDNLESGVYTLEVTDGNGCTVVVQFNVIFDNVIEIENVLDISVYPNPSEGLFNIQWDSTQGGEVQYNLIDAVGRTVDSGIWYETGSTFNVILDLSKYKNGIYSLSVISNGMPSSIQLIKAK